MPISGRRGLQSRAAQSRASRRPSLRLQFNRNSLCPCLTFRRRPHRVHHHRRRRCCWHVDAFSTSSLYTRARFWATLPSGILFLSSICLSVFDHSLYLTLAILLIHFLERRTLSIIQPLLQCITALQSFCAQRYARVTTDPLRFDSPLASRLATAATLSFASPSLVAALTASSEEQSACESDLVDTRATCWFEWLRFAADAESSAVVDDLVAAAGAQHEQPTDSHACADASTANAVSSCIETADKPSQLRHDHPNGNAWVLVSDWIPCPIGMLPRSLASPSSSAALMMTMAQALPPIAPLRSPPPIRPAQTQQQTQQQNNQHQQHPQNFALERQQRADSETAAKRRRLDSEHVAVELL